MRVALLLRLLGFSDKVKKELKEAAQLQTELAAKQKTLSETRKRDGRGRSNKDYLKLQNDINTASITSNELNEKLEKSIKETVKTRREDFAVLKEQELVYKANVALIKQRAALLKSGQQTQYTVIALAEQDNLLIDEKIKQAETEISIQKESIEKGKKNLGQKAKIKEKEQEILTLNASRVSKEEIALNVGKAQNVILNARLKVEKALEDIQNRRTSEAIKSFNLVEKGFLLQEKLKNLKTDPRGAGLSATQTLDARKNTEEKLNTTRKALIDKEFSQRKEAATKEFSVLRQRLVISKLETNMLNKRIELSNRQLAKEIKTAKAESKRQYNEDLVRVGLMRAAIDQQAREKEISSFSDRNSVDTIDTAPLQEALSEVQDLQTAALTNIAQERLNALAEDKLAQAVLKAKQETETQERNLQLLQVKDGLIQKEVELRGQILEIEEKTVQLQGERISLLEETTRLQMRAANRADPTRTTGELTARDEYDLLTQKRFADEEKIAQIRKDAIDEAGGAEKMTAQDIMNMRKAMDEAGKQAGERALSLVDLQKKQAESEKNLALAKLELEKQAQGMKVKILEAEFSLLEAQIKLYNKKAELNPDLETIDFTPPDLSGLADSFESNFQQATANILTTFENRIMKINDNVAVAGERTVAEGLAGTKEGTMLERIQAANDADIFGGTKQVETGEFDESGAPTTESIDVASTAEKLEALKGITEPLRQFAMDMGPEGELVSTAMTGIFTISDAFTAVGESSEEAGGRSAAVARAIGDSIGAINSMMQASAKKKTAAIDREIAAEKKRDGQSKQSVEKIKQLEKKKESIARKAFNMNKKMLIAQTIANTAAGVMATMKDTGFFGSPLAMIVAAMGAAQVGLIASQKFEGGGGGSTANVSGPTGVTVGSRNNTVDLAKANSPSGELAYARGESGTGTGMSNFQARSPMGERHRAVGGYTTGFMVGEQGPELFMPDTPGEIVSADESQSMISGGASNVNFTISAIDASGVEQVLLGQRENIIGMIREAAHGNGEFFLEGVN